VKSARIDADSPSLGSNARSESDSEPNLEAVALTRAEPPSLEALAKSAPPNAEPSLEAAAGSAPRSASAFNAFLAAPRDCAGELQDWLAMRPQRTSPTRAGRRRLAGVFEALHARRDR
jgi:hypothetical protein